MFCFKGFQSKHSISTGICTLTNNDYKKRKTVFISLKNIYLLPIEMDEIFQQKHVFSTWNGQINGCSHVYKIIE